MDKFCKSCGTVLSPGAKFCGCCGTKTQEVESIYGKEIYTEYGNTVFYAKKGRKKPWVSVAVIVLAIALTVGILPRIIGGNLQSETVSEGVLSPDNLVLSGNGVSMALNPISLDTETAAKIAKVDGAPPLNADSGIELAVYDFSVEGVNDLAGVIDLTIPLVLSDGAVPGAAYLNENTGFWEPVAFRYDRASGSVVISTDHLSKYGVFSVSGEGLRKAYIEFLMLGGSFAADENFLVAIEEYTALGVPASECVTIGVNAVKDSLQIGSDILGGAAQSAGFLVYGDDVLSTVGNYLGNIGLMTSVVQVGLNVSDGKIHEALVESMKMSWSYTLGKVTSKLSSSVMSASMAAVAFVDYSINKFGTEAIAGRASIYRDAYKLYYQKNERGYKSSAYWFQTLYPLFEARDMSEDELKAEIDRIITAHCREFWGGDNVDGVDAYIDMARKNFKWTGGGAGLNDTIRNEISSERRTILYNDIIPGVIYQIARKINLENERKLRAEYRALSDYLNTSIAFSLIDSKKTYAGYTIRFAPLDAKADSNNWTGKIRDNGTANTSFTLYGHMYAGAPNTLEIYEPSSDTLIKTVPFKVTPPKIEIVLDDEAPSPQPKVEGTGSAEPSAESVQPAAEKEYAWVLVDVADYENAEKWTEADAHPSYAVRYSYSRGSYSASVTYEGDDPYDEGLSGTLALQAVFSGVPEIIYPDQPLSLNLSFTTTQNDVVKLFFSGSAAADFDLWDLGPGGVTRGARRFVNAGGESSFSIHAGEGPSSYSETLTAQLGAGSEGSRIALRTSFYMGTSIGTNFIYEWKQVNNSAPILNTEGIEGIEDID